MIGRTERWQEDLFVAGPLRDLVPNDHLLKRVDRVLDLSWLRGEVAALYDESRGRPSIDPEAAARLMLAGFLLGLVKDRHLMREAQVNLAIRWFAGYRLTDTLPDHSSLTRIRQRWGEAVFAGLFKRIVEQCVAAGLVKGDIAHIDATLVRADVSWESLVQRHLAEVKAANDDPGETPSSEGDGPDDPDDDSPGSQRPREGRSRAGKPKKYSPTDPDATLATASKQYRMEPCFKQHTAVDDQVGIIVDVQVTTGEASEGRELERQIERIEAMIGQPLEAVTCDAGYAHAANYGLLEARGIEAIIPPQKMPRHGRGLPMALFQYDARHQIVRCPAGQVLTRRGRSSDGQGWMHHAGKAICQACHHVRNCVPPSAKARVIRVSDHYEALLRARRRHRQRDERYVQLYRRHRWRSEGVHGEMKSMHGLRRAVRRGLANMRVQSLLTATVINLKRMAKAAESLLRSNLTRYAVATRLTIRKRQPANVINADLTHAMRQHLLAA